MHTNNKNHIIECLDYLILLLYMFFIFINTTWMSTFYINWNTDFIWMAGIILGFAVFAKLLLSKSWDLKEALLAVLFCAAWFFSCHYNGWILGDPLVWNLLFLVIGMKGISQKKILLGYLFVNFSIYFFTIVNALIGNINNYVYYRSGNYTSGVKPRMAFGMVYPTDFAAGLFFMCVAYIWIRTFCGKKKWIDVILLLAVAVFCYCFCDARTTSICIGLLATILGSAILFKKNQNKKINFLKEVISKIACISMPILAFVMIFLSALYKSDSKLMTFLDKILSYRLSLGRNAFDRYRILPWGQFVEQHGFGGGVVPKENYFFLDSSYVNVFFRHGYILLLVICVIFTHLCIKEYKNKRILHLLLLATVTLSWSIEATLLSINMHPFLVFIFADMIYQEEQNEENNIKKLFSKFTQIINMTIPYIMIVVFVIISFFAYDYLKKDKVSTIKDENVKVVDNNTEGFECVVDEWKYSYNESINKGTLYVSGWATHTGVDADDTEISVVLKLNGNYYNSPGYINYRKDVTEYKNDGVDYDKSGYYTYLTTDAYGCPVDNNVYDLYLRIKEENSVYYINMNQELKSEE